MVKRLMRRYIRVAAHTSCSKWVDYDTVACANGLVELSSCWIGECMDGV